MTSGGDTMQMEYKRATKSDRHIALLLRIDACLQILALFAVVMPFSWMIAVHEWLGLGEFPRQPIAEYLARSLSAFYALHGVITLMLASDVPKYRDLIRVWALSFVAFGVLVMLIDVAAGLPAFWTISEGPFMIAFGLVIIWLLHRSRRESTAPSS